MRRKKRGAAPPVRWRKALPAPARRPVRPMDRTTTCCGLLAALALGRRPTATRATQTATATAVAAGGSDPLAVFVVLRKDLDWPTGALINQACHACTAMAYEAREDAEAESYFSEGREGSMVKSTLGAKSQAELEEVTRRLEEVRSTCPFGSLIHSIRKYSKINIYVYI